MSELGDERCGVVASTRGLLEEIRYALPDQACAARLPIVSDVFGIWNAGPLWRRLASAKPNDSITTRAG